MVAYSGGSSDIQEKGLMKADLLWGRKIAWCESMQLGKQDRISENIALSN